MENVQVPHGRALPDGSQGVSLLRLGVLFSIIKAPTARAAKALGRRVKDFDDDSWRPVRAQVLYIALRHKFTQSEQLQQRLLDTGLRTLAEASPVDRLYGIGASSSEAMHMHPLQWTGGNLQGDMLMRLRGTLRAATADATAIHTLPQIAV